MCIRDRCDSDRFFREQQQPKLSSTEGVDFVEGLLAGPTPPLFDEEFFFMNLAVSELKPHPTSSMREHSRIFAVIPTAAAQNNAVLVTRQRLPPVFGGKNLKHGQ